MEPDGYVYVTYRELALTTENKYEERSNGRRFNFSDIRYWTIRDYGVHIETEAERTIIPFVRIDEIAVYKNSPEYVEWYKQEHPSGPVSKFAQDQYRER